MKLKILIIDDEMDFCMIMKSFFQSKSYEVTIGSSVKDCLAMLENNCPDILMLDNNLPDGKGWDNVGSIIKKYPKLRVYLISAYHQKADPLPRVDHVTVWEKPISLSLLNKTFA